LRDRRERATYTGEIVVGREDAFRSNQSTDLERERVECREEDGAERPEKDPARYEIEFQGSNDGGATWTPYAFRYKPQDPLERPGIYAPYQPRFEWNLWFASLAPWQASPWVVEAQRRLLEGSRPVLSLFRRDPFAGKPPRAVRTVLWQYWFTDAATKRSTGAWWRRQLLGVFAGTVTRDSTGRATFEPPPPG
jgi:hypothetical protein